MEVRNWFVERVQVSDLDSDWINPWVVQRGRCRSRAATRTTPRPCTP